MGRVVKWEQLELPPTDAFQIVVPAEHTENEEIEIKEDPLKQPLAYAWHVVEVLALDGQLEAHVDNGRFVPFSFMEESLQALVADSPPLTTGDVWQLALELHSDYNSLPLETDDPMRTLDPVAA